MRCVFVWSKEKKLALNIGKCEVSFFTTNFHEFDWWPSVEVDGRPLAFNPTPKFLSFKFDRMFSFVELAKEVAARMVKGSGVLKALAGSDWGWGGNFLRRVYQSVLQSVSYYCAAGCQP